MTFSRISRKAAPKLAAVIVLLCSPAVQAADPALAQRVGPCAPAFAHFDRALLLETTSETSANVGIGDLTGNGNLDIVLAKGRHWSLRSRVLLNDGHGRFAVARDLAVTPYRSYSAVLADVNGDRSLDIVLSNDTPDPKLVYLNDGKGDFRPGSTSAAPSGPRAMSPVADLNGDGLPDIVVANRYGNSGGSNYVCLNRGYGKFDADCIAFSHESATTITPADFNGDGIVDLAVPNRDGGQSYVYPSMCAAQVKLGLDRALGNKLLLLHDGCAVCPQGHSEFGRAALAHRARAVQEWERCMP